MNSPEPIAEERDALEAARGQGIHTIPVPTPFAVGRVNCYLLEGDPLTLVDAGPRSERSWAALEAGIIQAGYRIADLDLIVATHQHIDHIGQISGVADASGAEVAALDLAVRRLAEFGYGTEEEDRLAVGLMVGHGVPEEVAEGLKQMTASFHDWGGPVTVTRPLAVGSSVRMGSREYEVLHRPGHSPSDTVFWDSGRGVALAGDHLLSHISSNPLIAKPLDGSRGRTRSLIDYERSLRLTREMPIELMLSGHGVPILDHVTLIDKRLEAQERRSRKILGLLRDQPRTAHSIAESIWGNVAMTQAYLTLSEVIGHLDILIERGEAERVDSDRTTGFRRKA
ncbi:MAG: MBL fold metallo-hydrolase [Solirubrobacterales bacterium]|nr:MBL fold metallo-hydrolase [Solirubrobacterales bacterium]